MVEGPEQKGWQAAFWEHKAISSDHFYILHLPTIYPFVLQLDHLGLILETMKGEKKGKMATDVDVKEKKNPGQRDLTL